MKDKPCPFCGSKEIWSAHATLDGFTVPIMFCDGCKSIFTVEGSEDYITDTSSGFAELQEAWNTRYERTTPLDELLCRHCGYSIVYQDEDDIYTWDYCPHCGAKVVKE